MSRPLRANMARPSVQDGSNPSLVSRDSSNANLSTSHATGGTAAPLHPAAVIEDLRTLEMPSDSTPSNVPVFNYPFSPQSHFPPSFSGDPSSYDFNFVIQSGEQSFLIDSSQSLNTFVSVNSSSSTEPWNSLDATGVSAKPILDQRRQQSSSRGITTQAKNIDAHSDTFEDSGLGTLEEPSQYDTRSQLSAPMTDMNQPGQFYFGTPLPSQPQEVDIEDDDVAELGGDEVQEVSPTQARSRRGTKVENVTCDICHIKVKTPSDLKKHTARHFRDFKCQVEGCPKRINGFATVNDLNRHEKSVHRKETRKTRSYKCFAPGCTKSEKIWPRLDNFKQHLNRMHKEEPLEELLRTSNQWYDATNPTDPAHSQRLVDEIHVQEQRVKADKNKARKQGLRQERQGLGYQAQQQPPPPSRQQQRLPSLQSHQPQISQQDPNLMSTTMPQYPSAKRQGPVRTHPHGSHVMPRPRPEPYSRPRVSQPNQSFVPVQPQNMARSSSEMAPQTHRRHTTAGPPKSTPSVDDHVSPTAWELPEQVTDHQDLQESQSMFGQDPFGANPFILEDLEQPGRPHTVADPNAMRDYHVHFMYETEPIPPPHNPELDILPDPILFAQIGAANDTTMQISPASGNQPHTPTILINGPSDDVMKDYQDVIVQELRSFLDKHDGKHNDKVVTREEIQQHVRRALQNSLTSRSTAGTLSEVQSLTCPKIGKTHFQCQTCGVFKLRQSDLNKHEKRHSRPYGCVFDNCHKDFGSKNDWKRHENTHPEQKECFRCDGSHRLPGSRTRCQKVFYNGKDNYRQHLREYGVPESLHETVISRCRVRGSNQFCFWCGFCNSVQTHDFTGTEALKHRLAHIDQHFQQGKKRVADWIELGGEGKTKSQVQKDQNAAKMRQVHSKQRPASIDEDTMDSQSSSNSSSASPPDEQAPVVQPLQAPPRTTQQAGQRLQHQSSNPSASHQQISQQQMWAPQQEQQQQQRMGTTQHRAQNRHGGSQSSERQQHPHRPFQDPARPRHVTAAGQLIAETLTCCSCENQWSFSFGGKHCTVCGHWCDRCGRE